MDKTAAAVLTMTGAIIGAGVFGIPYVVERSGFWTGMLCLLVLGMGLLVMNLMVGEVVLRTKKPHQFTGYAEKYLGKSGKWLMLAAFSVSCYTALIAYTIGCSQTLFEVFGYSRLLWAFVFYLVMSVLVYGDLKVLSGSEYFLEYVKFIVFAVLLFLIFTSSRFDASLLQGFYWQRLLMPVGVILFAFSGMAVIPLLRNILGGSLLRMRKVIVLGSLIPIVVYALFAVGVVGISGFATTEVATVGLASFFSTPASWLIHAFAFLAMMTSFLAYGYVLKWMFIEDFNLSPLFAWLLTMLVPPVMILFGFTSFFRTLDLGGSLATGMVGILFLFIHLRARKLGERKPEYRIRLSPFVYMLFAGFFLLAMLHSLVAFS